MHLLPKNTLETLVASSVMYPAASATALLSAMKTIWKVAIAATRWLKDKFTGHMPTRQSTSWNVKGNLKTGEFSSSYRSESSTHLAVKPTHRTKVTKETTRATANRPKPQSRKGPRSRGP